MTENVNFDDKTQMAPHQNKGGNNRGIFISVLSIIVLIVILYVGFFQLFKINNNLQKITIDIGNQVKQNQNDIVLLQKKMDDTFQTINEQLDKQGQSISGLARAGQNARDQLSIAEAQYLVKIANDNLQIGDNVSLVINLLQTADQEIADLNDVRSTSIRKALADDITALQAVPQVDITGTYLKLAALNNEVNKLPLPNKRPAADQGQASDENVIKSWWKRGLQQTWNALRKVIIVRYNEQDSKPFILPEQQDFLYQNIHALYEQAMSAVVHRQPEIYKSSLRQIDIWIKDYFLPDSSVTRAQLKDLDDLQNIELTPVLPNISASLQAFRDYFSQNNHSMQTSTAQ